MVTTAYRDISKEVEITSLDTIEFLDTSVSINNPHWQSSGIMIFLCKYYIVISDTPVVSFFLGCALIVAGCNIIRASWETKMERLSYRKKYIEEFVRWTSHFWLHALLSMSVFVAFFVCSLHLPKCRIC